MFGGMMVVAVVDDAVKCGACARVGTNAVGGPKAHSPDCPKEQAAKLEAALAAAAPKKLNLNSSGRLPYGITHEEVSGKKKK